VTGTGADLADLGRAVSVVRSDASPYSLWVAWPPLECDAGAMSVCDAPVVKRECRIAVSRDQEVRPAVIVEVEHGECFGIARYNQPALGRRHRHKMAVAIPAKQLAQSAVETANRLCRCVRVLHDIDIGMPFATEIAGHDAIGRSDLRDPRQRLETVAAVRLAEKHSAAEFRGL